FVDALPKAYPAVAAKKHTWSNYARAFAHWFQFAGLMAIEREDFVIGQESAVSLDLMAPGKKRATKGVIAFPRVSFQPVLKLLRDVRVNRAINASRAARKALGDAKLLGLLIERSDKHLELTESGMLMARATPRTLPAEVMRAIESQPAVRVAK